MGGVRGAFREGLAEKHQKDCFPDVIFRVSVLGSGLLRIWSR